MSEPSPDDERAAEGRESEGAAQEGAAPDGAAAPGVVSRAREPGVLEEAACEAAARHGVVAESTSRLDGGEVNHVFRVGNAVVRFPRDRSRPDEFGVEEWCARVAPTRGIAVAACLGRGTIGGVPYVVHEFVAGRRGSEHPKATDWDALGRVAGRLADVEIGTDAPAELFTRFGRDLRLAWREHVAYNLGSLEPGDPLEAAGVYAADQRATLRSAIEALGEDDSLSFGLAHGDLAPRNLVERESGELVVLDWGTASTGPVPWTDLVRVVEWSHEDARVGPRELAAFARGCGVDLEGGRSRLEALVLLRSLDLARWAHARRPDLAAEYDARAARVVALWASPRATLF